MEGHGNRGRLSKSASAPAGDDRVAEFEPVLLLLIYTSWLSSTERAPANESKRA